MEGIGKVWRGGFDRAGLDALKGNAIAGITINDGARMLNRSE